MIISYNLAHQPITYDFVIFLTLCEQERLLNNEDSFYITINTTSIKKHSKAANYDWEWRITHLLMPLAMMMPNCRGVGIGTKGIGLGYNTVSIDKDVYFDKNFKHITAGQTALDMVYNTTNLITLRERRYEVARNSNVKMWRKIFNKKNDLIIDDLENKPSLYNINVELRMAFYMKSKMNWLVSNGCGALMMMNPDIAYRVFKITTPGIMISSASWLKRTTGMSVGEHPHIATENQKWIWKDDTAENVLEEINSINAL